MSTTDVRATGFEGLTGDYALDPDHTRLWFVARHAMVTKVRGTFTDFEGSFHLDGHAPTRSTANVTIRTASIDTRNEARDAHLRSNDFFDVDAHPEITFASSTVEQLGPATFRLTGDLTIKGISRPVSIDFEYTGSSIDDAGAFRVGFEGSTVVDRREWGLAWNLALDAGGVLVGDKVTLQFDVSAVRVE